MTLAHERSHARPGSSALRQWPGKGLVVQFYDYYCAGVRVVEIRILSLHIREPPSLSAVLFPRTQVA